MVAHRIEGYADLARAISDYKESDSLFCTRLIGRTVQILGTLHHEDQIVRFYEPPPSTDDERWDALIAGVATHTWSVAGNPGVPAWTKPFQALDDWWEPAPISPKWTFWNMVHTPPSIRERKIIFPSQWLRAV